MSSYFLNLPFNNFDHLQEMAKQWGLEYFQQTTGPADIYASQIVGEEVSSAHFYASCSFRLLGAPPSDMWTVMLSSQNKSSRQWLLNRKAVPEYAITVYPPGYDFNNYFQAGYECYTFSMSHEYLGQLCEDFEIVELFSVMKRNDIVECSVAAKEALWKRATEHKFWVDRLGVGEGFSEVPYWHETERELLRDILLTVAECSSVRTKYRITNIPDMLKIIDEYFFENPYADLSVNALSNILGISERTMQYNFQKQLGISPKKYLKTFRLNRVQKELLRASSHANINDIAFRYGFWHMGQFAADYRKLFGELPSETRSCLLPSTNE